MLEIIKEGKTVYVRPADGKEPVKDVHPTLTEEQESNVHPPPATLRAAPKLTPAQGTAIAELIASSAA